MREFLKKYSAEILILLSAITGILNTLATHEGANAVLISVLIAVVAIVVEVLKNGISEEAITLLGKAILIIIEEVKKSNKKDEIVAISSTDDELTIEDIKQRLIG